MLQQWWMGFDALWLALDEIHRTAKSQCACVVITAQSGRNPLGNAIEVLGSSALAYRCEDLHD
jgi:hypothetical protein